MLAGVRFHEIYHAADTNERQAGPNSRFLIDAYPKAEIVMLLGGMESGSQSVPLNADWGRAVARLEAADPHMHHFVFRHWTPSHPRVSDHRILADELISWLRVQRFMARFIRP